MRLISTAGASVLCLFVMGCANILGNAVQTNVAKHEALMKDVLKELENLCLALESVKDRSTAKAAAPKIEMVADGLGEIGDKLGKLPKIPKSEDEKLKKRYEPRLKKLAQRLQKTAFQAGMNSGGEPTFLKSLKKLEKAGRTLQKLSLEQKSKKE